MGADSPDGDVVLRGSAAYALLRSMPLVLGLSEEGPEAADDG